jgi:hypothetical protein
VNEPGPALFLAVDEDLTLLVDLLEVEIPPVEEDLGMGLRDPLPLDGDVISEGRTHGAHGLVQGKNVGGALGREPLQDRQR